MNKYIIFVSLLCISLFTGCATSPHEDIKIDAEADPKVNFSGYKTYAWLGAAGLLIDPEGKWKQPDFNIDSEIQHLVNRELRKRKFTEVDNKPDMLIAYTVGIDMEGLKVKENPKTKEPMLQNIPKGALVVILVDPQTRYVMWVGRATADLKTDPGTEVMKQRLDYAVTQIMARLPK